MKQFKLNLNHRLSGVKQASIFHQTAKGVAEEKLDSLKSADGKNRITPAETQKHKLLKDRIKILEMELQHSREESFKAGYAEGKQSTLQEAGRRIEAMEIKLREAEKNFTEAIEQIEGPLLHIAKQMAAEVLADALDSREDYDKILFDRLRKMLYPLVEQNKVLIEVHPEHLKKLEATELAAELNLPKKTDISFIAGKNLKKGEAQIQSENFIVDGTFDGQLDTLHEQLMDKEQ